MDTETTIKLIRICHSGLRQQMSNTCYGMAVDLYDVIADKTEDLTIKEQMRSGRAAGYDRLKCLQYLKHRLNIDIGF